MQSSRVPSPSSSEEEVRLSLLIEVAEAVTTSKFFDRPSSVSFSSVDCDPASPSFDNGQREPHFTALDPPYRHISCILFATSLT